MSSTLKEDKGKVTAEGGGGKVPLLPSLEKIPAGVEMALETYSLAQPESKAATSLHPYPLSDSIPLE